MIPRKLTAILAGMSAGLIVLSAFAQTTPAHKKKKKKKPKHTTSAPAASASTEIELDTPPAGAAPATSAAPAPAAPEAPAADATPAAAPAADANASENASTDHAGASPSGGPWSAGLLLGWGFNAGAKLGFGVRGGYTLPMHLYVGATFVYHLGESEFGGTANFFYPGVEGGYELPLGPLLVRPYLGFGPMILHESLPPTTNAGVTVAQGSNSTTYFAVWPGVTASYAITPMFFIGADARYIFSSYSMLGLFLTGGARF